ncbi:uncharacterized protein LOC119109172 [Pollicipes pollicipes]|uniref:uncharacterized protein LOC119109172 n=1 Tax=Pollicipes pollicipes TaxID=41117 RepID=UPI0018849FDC|nr:uncharacterized protein LOC119104479 isoform X1 [Pollicipes pollicipes]XP_037084097.1 uncharacterized protein LOC119104479 isoform X1 [Pollicipes pollicipes]XP_037088647.1 uncharacterized protein LOC119109172 [Pollicipes pollicipes]
MVHWKRDLDLYTIGRPLERNAGFWLDYMKGLKGDHGDLGPRRLPVVPRPRARSLPRWAEPNSPFDRDPFRDPFTDPFFADPIDTCGLPHSPAYDDLRAIMDRARKRFRDRRFDAERRALDL